MTGEKMEKRVLQPEQIIVPGEYELWNESILKIYFRIFDRGHGEDLPPVIVARNDLISSKNRQTRLEEAIRNVEEWKKGVSHYQKESGDKKIAEIKEAYKRFNEIIATIPYYLIDGNHKSASATLTHSPIYSLELQSSKDVAEVRRMVKRGELFDFKRSETSLRGLVLSFEKYLLGSSMGNDIHIKDCRTVKERIDELTSNGDLPKYMRDRYLKGK